MAIPSDSEQKDVSSNDPIVDIGLNYRALIWILDRYDQTFGEIIEKLYVLRFKNAIWELRKQLQVLFSVRTTNSLIRGAKNKSLSDIFEMTDSELLEIRNIGDIALDEIRTAHRIILEAKRYIYGEVPVSESMSLQDTNLGVEDIEGDLAESVQLVNVQDSISSEEGNFTTDRLVISKEMELVEINENLSRQFARVQLIGELPITKDDFNVLIEIIRLKGMKNQRPNFKAIPEELLLTSMVFCARYSDVEIRSFWEPYARLVWGLANADMSFQGTARKYFIKSCKKLKRKYDSLPFSLETEMVVRDIYTHAIVPFYLQHYFAEWLQDQKWLFNQVNTTEEVTEKLQNPSIIKYAAPTLRRFFMNSDTSHVAANLIQTLVSVADLSDEGASEEDIQSLLEDKPIYLDMWKAVSDAFTSHQLNLASKRERKYQQQNYTQVRWVWSLEDDEFQLYISETFVTSSTKPICWEWHNKDQSESIVFYVDPWQTQPENWRIEEVYLDGIKGQGIVCLVDENQQIIKEVVIPSIELESVQFYKIDASNTYGKPISKDHLLRGEWLVSMPSGTSLVNEAGQVIEPRRRLRLPSSLQGLGHGESGQYELTFPLTVIFYDGSSQVIESSRRYLEATLEGEKVPQLSPSVIPIFLTMEIKLVIYPVSELILKQLRILIKADGRIIRSQYLTDLLNIGALEYLQTEQQVIIYLEKCIPSTVQSYEIELYQNLQPKLAEPLRFSALPQFQIFSPDIARIPSPLSPPIAHIIPNEDYLRSSKAFETNGEIIPVDSGYEVVWANWERGCHVWIENVHIQWDVAHFKAWTNPDLKQGYYTLEDIRHTNLYIRGPKNKSFALQVNDGQKRYLQLNAKGWYETIIGRDQLFDMLQEQDSNLLSVYVTVDGQTWQLFEILRCPEIQSLEVEHFATEQQLFCQVSIAHTWEGMFTFRAIDLINPSNVIILGVIEYLTSDVLFSVDVPTGIFQLEILFNDEIIPIEKSNLLITERFPSHIAVEHILQVIEWLKNPVLPFPSNFFPELFFVLQRSDTPLKSEILYTLITASPEWLKTFTSETLGQLWPLLGSLAKVFDVSLWDEYYGSLPDWIMMRSGFHVNMTRPRQKVKVFSENNPRMRREGQGYAEIRFNEFPNTKIRVYVYWQTVVSSLLKLKLTLPNNVQENAEWQPLISEDISFWRCKRCGKIVNIAHRDAPINDRLISQHKHGGRVLNIDFLPELEVEEAHLLPESLVEPENENRVLIIDRMAIMMYMTPHDIPEHRNYKLTTVNGYREAIYDWVVRHPSQHESLQRFILNKTWEEKFIAFKNALQFHNRDIPILVAAGKMLRQFENSPADNIFRRLDEKVFLLALSLRVQHYGINLKLFTPEEAVQMLSLANQVCPSLLEWAFTWVELICIRNTTDII